MVYIPALSVLRPIGEGAWTPESSFGPALFFCFVTFPPQSTEFSLCFLTAVTSLEVFLCGPFIYQHACMILRPPQCLWSSPSSAPSLSLGRPLLYNPVSSDSWAPLNLWSVLPQPFTPVDLQSPHHHQSVSPLTVHTSSDHCPHHHHLYLHFAVIKTLFLPLSSGPCSPSPPPAHAWASGIHWGWRRTLP